MRRFMALVTALAAIAGGSYFYARSGQAPWQGLNWNRLLPSQGASSSAPIPGRSDEAIRIASFNIQVFGESKLAKPQVVEILAEAIRRFDVVAVQEVRAANQLVLRQFVDQVNAAGQRYDFVIGPRLGRSSSKEQYAFIFDTTRVEIDREAVYTVEDPDDLLHREPLVAGFRALGPPVEDAFTFTLVNIHIDPDEVKEELEVLDDVFRAVVRDGRQEDDVILLGDFNADENRLGPLGQWSEIVCAIRGVPTNTRGTAAYDNILFLGTATREFTGRAGVFDILREFNLTMNEALEVSDHFPVWAEFSRLEAGRERPLAARPQEPAR